SALQYNSANIAAPCMLECMMLGRRPAAWAAAMLLCVAVCAAQDEAFDASFRNGAEALRAGRLEDAAGAFQKCTQLEPNFAEAFLNLGLTRFQQNRFEDAAAALTKAAAL